MPRLTVVLAVGTGGFIGAVARYCIAGAVAKLSGDDLSYLGTLAVNLIGCFLIGVLATVADRSDGLSPTAQKLLISGLLGSLTTFSTFAFDSLNLAVSGRVGAAIANVTLNVVIGIGLVWLGSLLAVSWLPQAASTD